MFVCLFNPRGYAKEGPSGTFLEEREAESFLISLPTLGLSSSRDQLPSAAYLSTACMGEQLPPGRISLLKATGMTVIKICDKIDTT